MTERNDGRRSGRQTSEWIERSGAVMLLLVSAGCVSDPGFEDRAASMGCGLGEDCRVQNAAVATVGDLDEGEGLPDPLDVGEVEWIMDDAGGNAEGPGMGADEAGSPGNPADSGGDPAGESRGGSDAQMGADEAGSPNDPADAADADDDGEEDDDGADDDPGAGNGGGQDDPLPGDCNGYSGGAGCGDGGGNG